MMADRDRVFWMELGRIHGRHHTGRIETRIKAVVLHVGGMEMNKALPEVDQLNFLPRVYQPVLMLNGKTRYVFSL
jgi:hypothetical protein